MNEVSIPEQSLASAAAGENAQVKNLGLQIPETSVPTAVERIKSSAQVLCNALDPKYFISRYEEQENMEIALGKRDKAWPLINGYFGNINSLNEPFESAFDHIAKEYNFGKLSGAENYVGDIIDLLLLKLDCVNVLEIGVGRGASLINIGFVKQDLIKEGRLVLTGSSLESIPTAEDFLKAPFMSKENKEFLIRNRHLVHFIKGGREQLLAGAIDLGGGKKYAVSRKC